MENLLLLGVPILRVVLMPQNTASDWESLHCLLTEVSMQNTVKVKYSPETSKSTNRLSQMIRMNKSTCQKRVAVSLTDYVMPVKSPVQCQH